MNCPVCNRILAPTLSICPSCGAMMNDSVREECEVKATPTGNLLNQPRKGVSAMQSKPNQPTLAAPPKPIFSARDTGDLLKKPAAPADPPVESAPASTLVEFQNKNATLPDWRLKMQNAVRQRIENPASDGNAPKETQPQTRLVTSGANALKAQIIEETAAEPLKNVRVANALKRIEQSRKAFFVEETAAPDENVADDGGQNKNYPFYIAARTSETVAKPPESKASVNVPPKPKLVSATAARNADGELDTNKLPPLPIKSTTGIESPSNIDANEIAEPTMLSATIEPAKTIESPIKEKIAETEQIEENDDLAPFAMRFNAGLFDLIIGSFASFILLAPFMLSGGEWLTFNGLLAFAATLSVVMFIYLTSAIGMFGRSVGMRLFSLELVDVEQNEYPTFHQAAVSSSVYLLSLIFGGIGFLTIPFNEEKRAVHDIVSGTIVVKEY